MSKKVLAVSVALEIAVDDNSIINADFSQVLSYKAYLNLPYPICCA
jgi:hypothetical protein